MIICRMVGLIDLVLGESTLFFGLIAPIFDDKRQYTLPAQVWLPYNYTTSPIIYWLTYIMNSVCAISIANLSVVMDVIIYGFMLITGCLIDLLDNRLVHLEKNMKHYSTEHPVTSTSVNQEARLLKQIIHNHIFIYELV
ncbi:PREDICTED: uncharacterized protein LOC105365170 [Ceratosolen solmsi marchali]|uniref:Uncharacterized protein LOC105365170 n=1 Tax=Ceratosolen solmsi marchali TaxID=326594 RepID=A0AAJ6YP11_9HYME|nr:PREDICTED: uncharacterized protein LOC105365170 [Ceratosolen solmsi marchali]